MTDGERLKGRPGTGVIDIDYLPYTEEQLLPHFTGDGPRHIARFRMSAERYRKFLPENTVRARIPIKVARLPCQVEKDETFWTATALKALIDSAKCRDYLSGLLSRAFGTAPPFATLPSWEECLSGPLRLVFEAALPSPKSYAAWLRQNHSRQHFIPYVIHAAGDASVRSLEGPTHVDAVIVNEANGFSVLLEAKVISDISGTVSFDAFRNQLVRNVDVLLERHADLPEPLCRRDPSLSLLALLTPRVFRDERRASRLYGWLYDEYTTNAQALARDLPHRAPEELADVGRRLGWLTFEDISGLVPEACPWLRQGPGVP